MGWEAPWHWVVIAILVIALFGYKKLPDASRSLGRSLRIFKTELKGMSQDDDARNSAAREVAREVAAPAEQAPVQQASAQQPQAAQQQQSPTAGEPPAAQG
jgi:sec-independent protein translocase protein TatA